MNIFSSIAQLFGLPPQALDEATELAFQRTGAGDDVPWMKDVERDNQYAEPHPSGKRHPVPDTEYIELKDPDAHFKDNPHDWSHRTKRPDGSFRYWKMRGGFYGS